MKIAIAALVAAATALAGSATAANILPGSGATVTGSSLHDGFDATIAAGNLINGTSTPAYFNGDPRWVFADGPSADQTLIVDLGSNKSIDYAGFVYNGQDRIPTSFEVLTSTDGVTFTVAAGPAPVTGYGMPGLYSSAYSFPPVKAQYVEFDFGSDSIGGYGNGGGIGQGAGIYSLNIQAVPEPAAWALMLVGFGALGAALRRRRETFASAV